MANRLKIFALCLCILFGYGCFSKSESKSGRKIASTSTTSATGFRLANSVPDYPVLPSNPNGAIRKSSGASNDIEPLDLFNRYVINRTDFPTALCNDGTKPVYYVRKGTGQGSTRWVIWLEGGGGCGSDDPTSPYWCGARKPVRPTDVSVVSSNNTPGFLLGVGSGIFSSHKYNNPDFYSYNQVLIHYCSSDFWRGTGEQKSIDTRTGEKWWFSGQKIVQATLKELERSFGFNAATNVILTGTSAGAFGATMNANMIRDLYPTKDVTLLIDAGWGFEFPQYTPADAAGNYVESDVIDPQLLKKASTFVPMTEDADCLKSLQCAPNERCADRRNLCTLPPYATKFVRVPFFVNHDELDYVLGVLGYHFNICTSTDRRIYDPWLNGLIETGTQSLARVGAYYKTRSGIHGMVSTDKWDKYTIASGGSSYKLRDVFGSWYFSRSTTPIKVSEAPSSTLSPDQEARTKGGCP